MIDALHRLKEVDLSGHFNQFDNVDPQELRNALNAAVEQLDTSYGTQLERTDDTQGIPDTRVVTPITKLPKLSHSKFKPGRLAGTYRFKRVNNETGHVELELDETFSPKTISFPVEMCPEDWVVNGLDAAQYVRQGITFDEDYISKMWSEEKQRRHEKLKLFATAWINLRDKLGCVVSPENQAGLDTLRHLQEEMQLLAKWGELGLRKDYVCYLSYNYDGSEYFYDTES
jgi:hypothetical protein